MLIPVRTKHRPEGTPTVTYVLMALNVAVFLLTSNGLMVHEQIVENWALKSNHFSPINMFTAMFLHADIVHLVGNLLFLWVFGQAVEGRLKPFSYATMYIASGIAGSLLHHWVVGLQEPNIPTLGASGAIMGVLAAALYMFPHGRTVMFYWILFRLGTFEVPLWGVALFYLGGDVVSGLLFSDSGVAHFAHIGGAIGGIAVTAFYGPERDSKKVSQVNATVADMRGVEDLDTFDMYELSKVQPENAELALHLVMNHQKSDTKIRSESLESFVRLLPKMLDECDCVKVAETVRQLNTSHAGIVSSAMLVEVASRVERIADPGLAASLYATALGRKDLDPKAARLAYLRMGVIQQERLNNPKAAATFFKRVVAEDDWCPLQDEAHHRLRTLGEAA